MDVLDGAPTRVGNRTVWLALALLLIALVAATQLRLASPTGPTVRLLGLDGSALVGESFVRFHIELVASRSQVTGVRLLFPGAASTPVAGRAAGNRTVVQLDLTPSCLPSTDPGALEVTLQDSERRERIITLPLAPDGPVVALSGYRCADRTDS